jgi:hypothetical protein
MMNLLKTLKTITNTKIICNIKRSTMTFLQICIPSSYKKSKCDKNYKKSNSFSIFLQYQI